jgi:hypothetical protein
MAPRYRNVRAVDYWDELGKEHDIGLAEASGPVARVYQDLLYSTRALIHGSITGNKLEVASAYAVPLRGLL